MSNLKKFIEENRRGFDDEPLPDGIWEGINNNIKIHQNNKIFSIRDIYKWSAAAAIFFIAMTSFYFLFIRKGPVSNDAKGIATKNERSLTPKNDIGFLAPEYATEARDISRKIEIQQKELRLIMTDQPELYSQFSQDLATLDSAYRVLKTQVQQTPSRGIIIRAMMQNLQLQAELLSKQLIIINEFSQDKNNQNEKSSVRGI